MSASTRTIQQPARGGSISTAIAMAAIVLAAAFSIAWGTANLSTTTSVAAPAVAPVVLPRDNHQELRGVVPSTVGDYYLGFTGNAPSAVGNQHQGAPGAHRPGTSDQLKDDAFTGSKQGAPAPRHAGFRAQ